MSGQSHKAVCLDAGLIDVVAGVGYKVVQRSGVHEVAGLDVEVASGGPLKVMVLPSLMKSCGLLPAN